MKILACQISADGVVTRSDMEAHQRRVADLIRPACERNAVDLVLLPELSAIEYSERAFKNLAQLAAPTDGWLYSSMAELACELKTSICFGMPRCQGEYNYISQLVIGRDGSLIGYYDKLHLAQFGASVEKPYFSGGDHICVFSIGGFRLGIVICYDMRFGDYISRIARDHHLDVILHPVAFSRDGSFASWQSFVCTRALENRVYWLSLNRAGSGWGHSIFCPPWFENESEVLVLGESELIQVIDIDRSKLQYAADNYPLEKDRMADYTRFKPTA